MRAKVIFFGLIQRYVSGRHEEVELPDDSTVGDLLAALAERHGAAFRDHLVSLDGSVQPEVLITVDGQNVMTLEGLATPLTPEADTHIVLIGPIVTGGRD